MTGKFNDEGATDDLSDIKGRDWGAVGHWIDFYADHKTYKRGEIRQRPCLCVVAGFPTRANVAVRSPRSCWSQSSQQERGISPLHRQANTHHGQTLDASQLATQATQFKNAHAAVGTLVGPYFDEDGNPTAELARVLRQIERQKHSELEDKRKSPPCNSKYTPVSVSWVTSTWGCTG